MFEKIGRNDLCWCGSEKKYKVCHSTIDEKIRTYKKQGYLVPSKKILKTKEQIEGIKESGKVNSAVLDYISKKIGIGMTTEEIDQLVHHKIIELGGTPATLHYNGFPKSVCTSVNDQVCHGIPSNNTFLEVGDIVNVDVSTLYKGYFSDSSRMFCLGRVDEGKQKLVAIAKEAIYIGLAQVKPWKCLGDMGQAINDFVRSKGFSVVEEIGGHGVGIEFHEEPFVSYVAKQGTGMLMVPGMVFTIEPMINMGSANVFIDTSNEWTAYTEDRKPSAQWEVTVAVTEDGYEVLAY